MIISILPSDKKGKKWMAKVDETGQTIYFGQAGAEDFTTHKDELKRKRWIEQYVTERRTTTITYCSPIGPDAP
jgi:hypothetical protein